MMTLLIAYIAVGIGVLGASTEWTRTEWTRYTVLFPLHMLALHLARDFWWLVTPMFQAIVDCKPLWICLFFLSLWYVLWLFSGS